MSNRAPGPISQAEPTAPPPPSGGASVLNLMAIPLGTVGLAGVWQAMVDTEDAAAWPARALFAIAAALWLVLTVRYLVIGRRAGSFVADRQDALFGPFAAYIPVIGILLATHYEPDASRGGKAGVVVFTAALTVLTAQLMAHWLRGNFFVAAFHPGYFLPTVAGPFIAAIGLAASGWRAAAASAFFVGIFLWLVLSGLLFSRLFNGPPLPNQLKPTLAILVSAPATAGLAWLTVSGGRANAGGYGIVGITVLMVVVQAMFVPDYLRLGFMPSFWAFTFPAAAAVNLAIRWLHATGTEHRGLLSWLLAELATAFVAAIAAATVASRLTRRSNPDIETPPSPEQTIPAPAAASGDVDRGGQPHRPATTS